HGLADASIVSFAVTSGSAPTVFASAIPQGVVKSTDQGGTWEPTSLGTPLLGAGLRMGALAVAPSRSSFLYVFVSYYPFIESPPLPWDLYQSTDGGATWVKPGSQSAPFQALALAVDAADPVRVYAGTVSQGVFVSNDGGATWSSSGLEGLTVSALKV